MEAGKPDETRKVGEEVVGPLSLPRPPDKAMSCISLSLALLGAVSFGLTVGTVQRIWRGALMLLTDWSKEEADNAIKIIAGVLSWGLWSATNALLRRRRMNERMNDARAPRLRLVLERRMPKQRAQAEEQLDSVRLSYTFKIWRAASFFRRALSPVIYGSAGATLLFGAATSSRRWDSISLTILGVSCLLAALSDFKSIYSPLLLLDEQGFRVEGGGVPWEQVQKVEVEHLLDFQGGYYATSWLILDEAGQRRARISIPKTHCSQRDEEELLAFAAQKLNVPLASVASSGIVSL